MSAPRKILVTGGGQGVGAAIVRGAGAGRPRRRFHLPLLRRGGRRPGGGACKRLTRMRAFRAHALDLADRAALDAFCETVEERGFHGLVHNAGQPYDVLAAMMDQDKAEAAMQVNFWSLTRLAKALVRGMIRARERADRRDRLGRGAPGQSRQRRLRGLQGRAHRLLPDARDRDREARHHRQRDRAGLRRHRHDGALRRPSRRHGEADPGRPLRQAGGGGGAGRLPDGGRAPPISPAPCCRWMAA